MANTLTPIIIIVFLLHYGSAIEDKTKPHTTSLFRTYETDGICSSMVESQGYACEEHKVLIHSFFFSFLF